MTSSTRALVPNRFRASLSAVDRCRREFRAMSPADRKLLLRIWLMLGAVSVLLRAVGFQSTRRFLARFLPADRPVSSVSEKAIADARRLGSLARIAACNLPLNTSCLRQSLLVWWILCRRGMAAELRIGVKISGEFSAHAWVELGGWSVNDSNDVADRFNAFDHLHP